MQVRKGSGHLDVEKNRSKKKGFRMLVVRFVLNFGAAWLHCCLVMCILDVLEGSF